MLNPGQHARAGVEQVCLPRDRLLLASSGGSDSVALLAALQPLGPERLTVAHVHHGLRAAADRDARHVRDLARAMGLPFRLLHAPPAPGASGSSETAARRRRLAALGGEARAGGQAFVLTGHHADDAAETVLLHLLRGHRGLRAMAGVPSLRPLAPGVGLLRPFLHGARPPGREELAAWRRRQGWAHVEDETNADARIPRNAVRRWLGEDRPPLDRAHVLVLRNRARCRLQHTLTRAADLLLSGLRNEGHGARLGRSELDGMLAERSLATEVLRLLGGCLATPRRMTLRDAVVARLRCQRRGQLELPAHPAPLRAELRRDGLHLPNDPLTPLDPAARLLDALARTALHL